ncbi:amine oxidase [Pluteus cervinus]|uniref:Amine oxidase n=1 Tax=Pluteus cervinus TaxID=181527 RepID=A0ACD3AWR0_9AGAR|nr:amine oxidase [Pluteus cervinus]
MVSSLKALWIALVCAIGTINALPQEKRTTPRHAQVLILGGGITGVIAARTFKQAGINNILVIEGREELGGRMRSTEFGGLTVELGANWIQGTQTGNGPINPILTLARKHHLKTQFNNFDDLTTYDDTGLVDFIDAANQADTDFNNFNIVAGPRVANAQVDMTASAGYRLSGAKILDKQAAAAQYLNFDFEYAQTPQESSWLAASWNNNFTFVAEQGGFSEANLMCIDQRGYKTIVQGEAEDFLTSDEILLNAVVQNITYSSTGVSVTLTNGTVITGDYALCTFSVGVLQHDDVTFIPPLPAFKQEAISSIAMATYTKIFLQFPTKFWFDTEMGLYADPERGRYPIWQSLDHPKFLPGSRILFVTVTSDFSQRVEAFTDEQVQAEVMDVVHNMFPNIEVPEPNAFLFPRWHSDPLYRGSYSNWPPSFFSGHHENLKLNVDRLYFAGEATSVKFFGFLHGAYFEGLNMANIIISCIEGNSTCNTALTNGGEVTNSVPFDLNN